MRDSLNVASLVAVPPQVSEPIVKKAADQVTQLKRAGREIPAALLKHISPLSWVVEIGMQGSIPLREADIRSLHKLVVAQSKPDIAGRYADTARFVNTGAGPYNVPSHVDVPAIDALLASIHSMAVTVEQHAFS